MDGGVWMGRIEELIRKMHEFFSNGTAKYMVGLNYHTL